jgi:glycosyltransferase involved in cell wall biosynthesis
MSRPKGTILQIIPRLEVGGAERAAVDVSAALVAADYRSLVISAGGPLVTTLERSGAEHFQWDVASRSPSAIWRNRQRLIDFINTEHVDVVHARSRAPAWSAYLATRRLSSPFVTTFHNAYSGKSAPKKFYNSVMARGTRIIAISRFIAEHIRTQYHAAADRIVLIPRGTDFTVFDPEAVTAERKRDFLERHSVPSNVPLIIIPARMSPTKCHELALSALGRLRHISFFCLVIGPDQGRDAYRRHLISLVKKLGLETKVCFVEQTDLIAAFAVADLVLSLSQKLEGFGRVPVEAQAMGVPVIATAIGATSENMLNGETGWLVPVGDVQALADAIARGLALGPRQRSEMAQKAMTYVRARFDVKQMCAATIDVYASLLPPLALR